VKTNDLICWCAQFKTLITILRCNFELRCGPYLPHVINVGPYVYLRRHWGEIARGRDATVYLKSLWNKCDFCDHRNECWPLSEKADAMHVSKYTRHCCVLAWKLRLTREQKRCPGNFYQSVNQSNYFIVRPIVDQRAGQLSLKHIRITNTEKNRN